MTADPRANHRKTNSGPSPVNKPQPGEEFFRQSIADLSRRLGERPVQDQAATAQASAEARRRAMQAYDLEHARKLRLILSGAGAVFVTAGIAWFVVILGEPEAPAAPAPIAAAQPVSPPPPVVTASSDPAPQAPQPVEAPPPQAAPVVAAQQPADPVEPPASSSPPSQTDVARSSDPSALQPPPTRSSPLGRAEIREVQQRLAGFGFNPGPIDGVAGPQTEVATQRYLEARGQPQMPPNEPLLLDQLRQDPVPQVAPPQVARRQSPYDQRNVQGSAPPARRSFDPFVPVKVAGAEITRFLQSVFR